MSFLASFDEAQGTYLIGAPTYMTMPTEMYSLVLNFPRQVAAVFALLLSMPSVAAVALTRKHIMGGAARRGVPDPIGPIMINSPAPTDAAVTTPGLRLAGLTKVLGGRTIVEDLRARRRAR